MDAKRKKTFFIDELSGWELTIKGDMKWKV